MNTTFVRELSMASAAGPLRAGLWAPESTGALPGVVLVDGSGDGAYDEWGGWPERIAACGAVVLTHDKPGSGGSPGNWMEQGFEDRARDTCAALDLLRAQPEVTGPVGLFGVSQGAWVSLIVAADEPASVDFVVSMSGPGVSVHAQDRYRIEVALRAAELSEADVVEALDWVDERTRRLLGGDPVEAVFADQQRLADRPWAPVALQWFDDADAFAYLARLLAFDPVPLLGRVTCPVLGLFGGADPLVPVAESVRAFSTHLPRLAGDPSGLAVFPGANHGLFLADPVDGVDRTSQLAPGFLPMLTGFLAATTSR